MRDLFPWIRNRNLKRLANSVADGQPVNQTAARSGLEILKIESQATIRSLVTAEYYSSYYPTKRTGGSWGSGRPVGVVDHFTGASTAGSSLRWFSNEPRKPETGNSSAHVLIDRNGTILVVVDPLTKVAFHATAANQTHLGIEHVNCGELQQTPTGLLLFMGTYKYPAERIPQVQLIGHGMWEPYTALQLVSNIVLKRLFRYSITTMLREHFVQHKDIDPNRKVDCGPLWPVPEINDLVFSDVAFRDMDWVQLETLTAQDTTKFKQDVRNLLGHS